MKVAENLFVSIDYRLRLESGQEVDSSPQGSPLGFVAGTGRIIPGLERQLFGREVGETLALTVEPEEAYGPVDEALVQEIPRDRFPEGVDVAPGMAFQARGPRGPVGMTVTDVKDETVTVDMNHPLAGKRLLFDVTLVEVRPPRAEELASAAGGCACGPAEQDACGCGPSDAGSGCGGGAGGSCGCG